MYRSLSKGLEIEDVDAFVASHIIGVPKQFDAYTSASLEVYDGTMEIQYVIESKCGKDLTAWNPGEKEILFEMCIRDRARASGCWRAASRIT